MKFNAMRHNTSYYMTSMGDVAVQIVPIENFSVIKVDKDTYFIPFGLENYKALREMGNTQLHKTLEKTIAGAGVSKYGYDRDLLISKIKEVDVEDSTLNVILGVLENELKSISDHVLTKKHLVQLIDFIFDAGDLTPDQHIINYILDLTPKVVNNNIKAYAIPALLDLMKQLDESGILDDIMDPKAMLKKYSERMK